MTIFPVIFPLVLLTTLGYLSARLKLVSQQTITEVSKVTFNFLIPLYLFHHIATADLSSNLSLDVFTNFYGVVLSIYLTTSFLFFALNKNSQINNTSASVFSLAGCYSNTIIVGLPVLVSIMDDSVAAIVFLIISFHSAVLFSLTSFFTQLGGNKKFSFSSLAKSTLFNPLLIGIFSGLIFNLLDINFTDWISGSFELLTKPALTLALLLLGTSLNQFQIKTSLPLIALASFIKLVALPLAVFLAATYVFELSHTTRLILVVLTACPTGVNAYLVAAQQNSGQAVLAGTVVFSTIASAITIPTWLIFLT